MDRPPTKAKPSAFEAEAKELDKRLSKLWYDYEVLFLRHPQVEGSPSTELLEKAQLLGAIRVPPWRKQLAAHATTIRQETFGGEDKHWRLRPWIERIPCALEQGNWDVQYLARDLVESLPAYYRLRCPGYPAAGDPDAFDAAAEAVATNIRDEVKLSKKCGDLNVKKIGQLALEAMGDTGARHLRVFRGPTG